MAKKKVRRRKYRLSKIVAKKWRKTIVISARSNLNGVSNGSSGVKVWRNGGEKSSNQSMKLKRGAAFSIENEKQK